jgi:hypothetical protein
MAKKEKKETKKQVLKSIKADISKKIEEALTDVKAGLGEKKFKKRLKKASAIFSDGMVVRQKEPVNKKTSSKKVKKEIIQETAADTTSE